MKRHVDTVANKRAAQMWAALGKGKRIGSTEEWRREALAQRMRADAAENKYHRLAGECVVLTAGLEMAAAARKEIAETLDIFRAERGGSNKEAVALGNAAIHRHADSRMMALENNKGERVYMPKSATIDDMVKLGVKGLRIRPRGTPLRDDEWTPVEAKSQ